MILLSNNCTDYWMITFHNRDTYLPGLHKVFSSNYVFSLPMYGRREEQNEQGTYSLSNRETNYLNIEGKWGCNETPINMEACVAGHLEREVGCRSVHVTRIFYRR